MKGKVDGGRVRWGTHSSVNVLGLWVPQNKKKKNESNLIVTKGDAEGRGELGVWN